MRLRKKSQNLNRSDSTGSSSGRKCFLAPTLSDPQALRTDKYGQKKKPNNLVGTGTANAASSGLSTPTGTRPRSQILQTDHAVRGKNQVLRPETTTESEEYEDLAGTSPTTTGATAKHSLPPLPTDMSSSLFHATTSQSMHGFDLQTSSPFDPAGGRSSNLNNNSSSTGSNVAPSTSKVANNAMGTNVNVAYEVHDWWSNQVENMESSDEDDEE